MEKIPTIFDRDWDGNKGVVNQRVVDEDFFAEAVPTEKLDGTNVRLTVRNHLLVRVEKRRNPDGKQKAEGIRDPWYMDASRDFSADEWIMQAANNTDLSDVPDGEWSGEAVGPRIQGNPLKLPLHTVILFSLPDVRERLRFTNAPHTFNELRDCLPRQKSRIGNDAPIEGIVWHHPDGRMAKIKTKDFK
jgi:hypothetical protein